MKELTKKAKGAIIGAVAGLAAIAVGVGVWQPWKQPDPVDTPDLPGQEEPKPQPPEEKGLTLTVGGEEVPCTLYEGDGWSIYVPEGWTAEGEGDSLTLCRGSAEETCLFLTHETGDYAEGGRWTSAAPGYRGFYSGEDQDVWQIRCWGPEETWEQDDRILTALARTFALGEETPFADMTLAQEPDWQMAEGKTVLWLDKDGFIVDDAAEKAVREEMLSWDKEMQANFTGKYRIEDLQWFGGYCFGPGEYIDAFETRVWYEVAPGGEEEIPLAGGREIRDGWLTDNWRLNVVLTHDGSAVTGTQILRCNDTSAGDALFLWDLERQDS